jgi:hypothetical protein
VAQVQRWIEVTPSQFPHEAEGLNIVRSLLPDNAPFRAWSNLEFRDGQGKWHEVDLLVLGRRRLHLVELKYYSGTCWNAGAPICWRPWWRSIGPHIRQMSKETSPYGTHRHKVSIHVPAFVSR